MLHATCNGRFRFRRRGPTPSPTRPQPNNARLVGSGTTVDEEKYFGIGVGIGLRQGQPELKGRLDAALKELINSGELETYALKYFPFKLHKDEWGQ